MQTWVDGGAVLTATSTTATTTTTATTPGSKLSMGSNRESGRRGAKRRSENLVSASAPAQTTSTTQCTWICATCTLLNQPKTGSCKACGQVRPSSTRMRPNATCPPMARDRVIELQHLAEQQSSKRSATLSSSSSIKAGSRGGKQEVEVSASSKPGNCLQARRQKKAKKVNGKQSKPQIQSQSKKVVAAQRVVTNYDRNVAISGCQILITASNKPGSVAEREAWDLIRQMSQAKSKSPAEGSNYKKSSTTIDMIATAPIVVSTAPMSTTVQRHVPVLRVEPFSSSMLGLQEGLDHNDVMSSSSAPPSAAMQGESETALEEEALQAASVGSYHHSSRAGGIATSSKAILQTQPQVPPLMSNHARLCPPSELATALHRAAEKFLTEFK